MPDPAAPRRFAVRQAGAHALRVLRAETPCRIAAIFERSFYMEAEGAMACLGGATIGAGPLNALIDVPEGMNWPASGLRRGTPCRRSNGAIYLGHRFVLSHGDASLWRPEPGPVRPDPVAVARALDRLNEALATHSPADGLAGCREPIGAARRWLAAVLAAPREVPRPAGAWVRDLIGHGPGLTPSGDDFVGGVLIALHALERAGAARHLAEAAARAAAANSNAISAAHLAAAGAGQGHAVLHVLLNDLLGGDTDKIAARLGAVRRIGHSSGRDSLTGMVTVLRAWLACDGVRRRAA